MSEEVSSELEAGSICPNCDSENLRLQVISPTTEALICDHCDGRYYRGREESLEEKNLRSYEQKVVAFTNSCFIVATFVLMLLCWLAIRWVWS